MKKVTNIHHLPDYVKRFVVKQFAGFNSPSFICGLLGEVYELALTADQVARMNPETPQIYVLGDRWEDVFTEERNKLMTVTSHYPISNKFERLEYLQLLYQVYKNAGNHDKMLECLEVARLETDSLYREVVRVYEDYKKQYKQPVYEA